MAEGSKPASSAAKPNTGYLYPNKKTNDKQPDYKGKFNDKSGKEFWVSAWKRMKDGEEMLSLAITDPADLPPRQGAAAPGASTTNAVNMAKPAPAAAPSSPRPTGEPLKEISPEFGDLFDGL